MNIPLSLALSSVVLAQTTLVQVAFAQTPTVSIQSASRTYYAQAFGYDYDFNDGISVQGDNPAPSGVWTTVDAADLSDYYGNDVAVGVVDHDSTVGTDALSFSLECTAATSGNLFSSDSLARTDYSAQFVVAAPVRVTFDAEVDADVGYNLANLVVERLDGTRTLVDLSADYGGMEDDDDLRGVWLEPGVYVMHGEVEAQAFGSSGSPGLASARAELAVRFFDAADFDCDGRVGAADYYAFARDWRRGRTAADFDLDGVVDRSDLIAYVQAWIARRR